MEFPKENVHIDAGFSAEQMLNFQAHKQAYQAGEVMLGELILLESKLRNKRSKGEIELNKKFREIETMRAKMRVIAAGMSQVALWADSILQNPKYSSEKKG